MASRSRNGTAHGTSLHLVTGSGGRGKGACYATSAGTSTSGARSSVANRRKARSASLATGFLTRLVLAVGKLKRKGARVALSPRSPGRASGSIRTRRKSHRVGPIQKPHLTASGLLVVATGP